MVSFICRAFFVFAALLSIAKAYSANLVDIYQLAVSKDPQYLGFQAA